MPPRLKRPWARWAHGPRGHSILRAARSNFEDNYMDLMQNLRVLVGVFFAVAPLKTRGLWGSMRGVSGIETFRCS